MRMQSLFLLSALSLVAVASPVQHQPIIHERRDLSSGWTKVAKAPRDATLPVRISLSQENLDRGQEALLAVSDPLSSAYGKHWTSDQVRDAFAPSRTTVQNAIDWLAEAGISSSRIQQANSLGALSFTATVEELENLSQAEYYLYEHPDMEDAAVGCDQYHVPSNLQGHIDFITPGIGLQGTPRRAEAQDVEKRGKTCSTNGAITLDFKPLSDLPTSFPLDKCAEGITPECIKTLYGVPDNATCQAGNSIGIYAELYTYAQADLDLFFQHFSTPVPSGSKPDFVSINGVKLQDQIKTVLNFEANLDVQMAWPLAYPETVTFLAVGASKKQLEEFKKLNASSPRDGAIESEAGFDNLLSAFDSSYCDNSTGAECGTVTAPKVVSISYGPGELYVPEAKANRLCNEFMKLGLQGTTVLASSGDGGLAPQLAPSYCYGPKGDIFQPSILASCPWVTAVGGTQLAANASVSSPGGEIVANQSAPGLHNYSPGSGFSNYHSVPAYQKSAVDAYFKQHPNPYPGYHYNGSNSSIGANGGVYNIGGRAYPDVAALSANIYTIAAGCAGLDGGTSYAAPIFAGIISRLNGERLAAGKSTVGFINPALYAHPNVMNDVTSGHNYGCKTQGFPAAKGWDMASGLGTPNYPKMKSLFMSLP